MPTTRSPYDSIGEGYARRRRPDPRIATQLTQALGDARFVLNVGAGTGSYEPADRIVVAVDPSAVMLAQRSSEMAPAVQACAESLPFADGTFDAALGVLTLHHWTDRARGLAECARVARKRVVLLTWDPASDGFWLLRDYLPGVLDADRLRFPSIDAYVKLFGRAARVEVESVPIPRDCMDGFLGAYWARPEAYLDPEIRAGISSFSRPGAEEGLVRLASDVASGAWHSRNGYLLDVDALDIGYRIVVAHFGTRRMARTTDPSLRSG